MSYRSFMGKYYLTDSDWNEINHRAADIREYYEDIQEEIRRKEEQERRREQIRRNERQRKSAREYLEEIEDLLEEEIEEDDSYDEVSPSSASHSFVPGDHRFSLATPELSEVDAYQQEYLSQFHELAYGNGLTRGIPLNMTFTEQLYYLMKRKGMTNVEVYKAANVDKSLFSRITSDKNYSPSKETAISICLALKLTLDEAKDLLGRAGFSISHSILRDAAIEYCFLQKIYNVIEVNILLDKLGCSPLSRIRY